MSNHQHTLIIDGTSGISGDMTVAALLDLGASEEHLREQLATLPVDGFSIAVTRVNKHGIDACDFDVQLAEGLENHDHDMAWLYGNEAAVEHMHEHEHHHHDHDHGDEDEHAHHHHHHDHDDDEECNDPACSCHHHHDHDEDGHEHHHHHHGHDADEVFISWGEETHKKYTKAEIERCLKALEDTEKYGIVLRAKGYVASAEGERWIHFDYVPGEPDIRDGCAMVTGRICVIGSRLNEMAVAELFGTAE